MFSALCVNTAINGDAIVAARSDKIAVVDTVDANFFDEWIKNVKEVLGDTLPDYLIIQQLFSLHHY